jgi:hypothetical protein
VLIYFLLFLITYGATAGVLHKHGSLAPGKIAVASTTVAVNVSDGTGSSSTTNPFRDLDCAVCQLHRQLSSGLLYAPVFMPALLTQSAPLFTPVISYLSATSIPRRGRAPPLTSLA